MKITTIGLDLAKNVFQVHGVDEKGPAVPRCPIRMSAILFLLMNGLVFEKFGCRLVE